MNRRLVSVLLAGALAVQLAPHAGARTFEETASAFDVTEPIEANRVDRVDISGFSMPKCPSIPDDWQTYLGGVDCVGMNLPLDYDEPNGATVKIPVFRKHAYHPERKRGTVFINPGGPGGSAVQSLLETPQYMPQIILDEYDIVAVEPRGVAKYLTQPRCFDTEEQRRTAAGFMLGTTFTTNAVDTARYMDGVNLFGRACGRASNAIMRSMSTAEVVRDHEVVRRALGEPEFNFMGFSYGSVVGQVYANMFPDRVGRIMIDGVVDGTDWTGLPGKADTLQDNRVGSAIATDRTWRQLLKQCDEAGPAKCAAAPGATEKYLAVDAQLHKAPLVAPHPEVPEAVTVLDRQGFNAYLVSRLYSAYWVEDAVKWLQNVHLALSPTTAPTERDTATRQIFADRKAAADQLKANVGTLRNQADDTYDSGVEVFVGVVCSDAKHPSSAWSALVQAQQADQPGRISQHWAWGTVLCSPDAWKAQDEDAYFGPFDKRLRHPLLVVGNSWDPATSIDQARKTAARQPDSMLVTSANWGHTGMVHSQCVRDAATRYFTDGTGQKHAECPDAWQPFSGAPRLASQTPDRLRFIPPGVDGVIQALTKE